MTQYPIMLIGEAYGEEEEAAQGLPFVGKSGWFIKQLLAQSGIEFRQCYATTVFNLQPKPTNDIVNLCGPKIEGIPGMPALVKGKHVNAQYTPELRRLYEEINAVNPNLIIALGATAAWALLGTSGIKTIRGAPIGATAPGAAATGVSLSRTFKVLPTYHPAAVLREWSLRPVILADLDKARRNSYEPDIRRPSREIWIEPTLSDLEEYEQRYIVPASRLSIDIETKGDQITCVGFAPSTSSAMVIPFWSASQRDGNYWRTLEDELIAWDFARRWCAMKPSVFQNGLYDIHRLWRTYGITCNLAEHDTMLLHHAQQPEMEKGLAFLATVYTEEASWKFMSKTDTLKKED
jgi:uracil-DNA glycosylase